MDHTGIAIAMPGSLVTRPLGADRIGKRAELDAEYASSDDDPAADLTRSDLGAVACRKGRYLHHEAAERTRGVCCLWWWCIAGVGLGRRSRTGNRRVPRYRRHAP